MSVDVDVLRRARARVDTPRKWVKGKYDDGTRSADRCRVCVLGAINWAVTGIPDNTPTDQPAKSQVSVAQQWLYRATNDVTDASLASWNDADSTHHRDVLAAFDLAIELAEAQP